MKSRIREFKNLTLAAIAVITTAVFVACSGDDSIIEDPQQPAGVETYTMTVQASKGGEGTLRV